jgi:CRISPR-associated endonuclease/helicase Cas3
MHKPAIVVGTVDSLVSKALMRAYGIGRASYPIDFALVTNGAHWVIDEIQLCPESTTTLRQLTAFARSFGTAEPFGLTCMSATVPKDLLETVDNSEIGKTVAILDGERTGELAIRLDAAREIRQLYIDQGDYAEIAKVARSRHRPGTLTLVVLNTVKAAREVYKRLDGAPAECTLLHSRFRGIERARLMADVMERPTDRIVVATQVVEAGVDLDAAVLITEAAPWPSLVQRAGRCNRAGRLPDAELCWVPPKGALPYENTDIDATTAELRRLEGRPVTSEDLLARTVQYTQPQVAVVRRSDFIELFDTSPDLSGNDIDIAPYVRDAEDLDAQLAWATWTPDDDDGRPPADVKAPEMKYRCRVQLKDVNDLARDVPVWRLDQVLGRWARVNPSARARPGEVLVVNASGGRYSQTIGFDPSVKSPVPECPSLDVPVEPASGTEDAYGADSASVQQNRWLELDKHSEDVRGQADRLLAVLAPRLSGDARRSVVTAAYLHDAGKAHPIWQDALCRLASEKDTIDAGRPWAKSRGNGRLRFADDVSFRHELASLLLLDGPLNSLLDGVPDPDLARYLVLAHHGKLRVQVREQSDAAVLESVGDRDVILGLRDGASADIPGMLGQPATRLTVILDQFSLGGDRSWTRIALGLRDRYGPFVLAYLETIVRIADWRASAGMGEAA